MEGLCNFPPNRGHNSPRILNRELFPHPLGPEIIKCMPGLISKFIALIRVSPLGDKMGTESKMILSLITI